MDRDAEKFEPKNEEWWLVRDRGTDEEIRAQWNARRSYWRIEDGDTYGKEYMEPLRRVDAPERLPWQRADWVS